MPSSAQETLPSKPSALYRAPVLKTFGSVMTLTASGSRGNAENSQQTGLDRQRPA